MQLIEIKLTFPEGSDGFIVEIRKYYKPSLRPDFLPRFEMVNGMFNHVLKQAYIRLLPVFLRSSKIIQFIMQTALFLKKAVVRRLYPFQQAGTSPAPINFILIHRRSNQ
jgi:hypothetical protein